MNVCGEFFGRHLFQDGSGWSRSCGCDVWGHGFPFLLRAVSTEVSSFAAPEAQSLSHQLGFFFICQGFVDLGNDIYIHCVVVFFFSKGPFGFPLLFFWHVPSDDPLYFVIVVVDLEGLFVPFWQGFWYVILVQDFF